MRKNFLPVVRLRILDWSRYESVVFRIFVCANIEEPFPMVNVIFVVNLPRQQDFEELAGTIARKISSFCSNGTCGSEKDELLAARAVRPDSVQLILFFIQEIIVFSAQHIAIEPIRSLRMVLFDVKECLVVCSPDC